MHKVKYNAVRYLMYDLILKELKRLKDRVRQARYRALRAEQLRMYKAYVEPFLHRPTPSNEEENLPTSSTENSEFQANPDATEPALDWEEIGSDTTTAKTFVETGLIPEVVTVCLRYYINVTIVVNHSVNAEYHVRVC